MSEKLGPFEQGNPNEAYAKYFIGHSYLNQLINDGVHISMDCGIWQRLTAADIFALILGHEGQKLQNDVGNECAQRILVQSGIQPRHIQTIEATPNEGHETKILSCIFYKDVPCISDNHSNCGIALSCRQRQCSS